MSHALNAEDVIVRRRRLGGELILTEVHAHRRAPHRQSRGHAFPVHHRRRVELGLRRANVRAVPLEPRARRSVPFRVETVPVDHRAVFA